MPATIRDVAPHTGIDPTTPSGLATKNYVDLAALASSWPPVAARTTANPNPGSGSAGLIQSLCRVSRTVHRVQSSGASQIRLEYGNWYTQQSQPGEVAGPNNVAYRAAIEYPAGVWSPVAGSTAWSASTVYYAPSQVTYGGATYVARQQTTAGHAPSAYIGTEWDVVTRYLVHWTGEDANRRLAVAGGGTAVSLPVALATPLRAGTLLAVTTEASTGATTQYIPPGDLAFTSSPGWDFALDYTTLPTPGAGADPVDSGITTQTTLGNSTAIPMPLAITGHAPSNAATIVLGDSILLGTGDNYVDSYVPGWAVRAIGSTPWWRAAKTGDEAGDFLSGSTKRMAIAGRCTRAIVDYGTNEIRDGLSAATVEANLVSVWTALAAAGLTVYQSTITPQTTSTDSWATVGNQTAASGFGVGSVWATVNTWLRAGAAYYFNGVQLTAGQLGHPLTGVLDVAAAVTDTTTTWAWKAAYTADGIHPNATGHAAMATAATPLLAPVAVTTSRQILAGTGLAGGGDLSADRTLTVAYGTTAGTAAQGNDSRVVGAEQTANKNAASGYAGLDASSLLNPAQQVYAAVGAIAAVGGAAAAGVANSAARGDHVHPARAPVTLTDAATIATDASTGTLFRVTLGGNRTLGNPTNPTDGQRVIWELIQDATGTRTIALGSSFALGTDIASITLTTTASKRDFLGAVYNSTAAKWFVVAFVRGY